METSACKTRRPQERPDIRIDWDAFDEVAENHKYEMPEGAITVADVMEKYGCGSSTAKEKMNKAVAAGWVNGTFIDNGTTKRYILPPNVTGELRRKQQKDLNHDHN